MGRNGVTMTMPNPIDLQGRTLFDARGDAIGVIEGVYLDNLTRTPEWAAVRLGPQAIALVPIADALQVSGGDLQVIFDRDMVHAAPHQLSGLDNQVTEATEEQLYRYYGSVDGVTSDEEATGQAADGMKERAAEAAGEARDIAGDVAADAIDVAEDARDEAIDVAGDARDRAAEVAASARDQAVAVVETAKEETAEVAQLASAEARELYETTKIELQDQAETQLEQLAEALHRFAGQALALARGNAAQGGQVGDLVGRAGRELQSVARDIEAKGSPGLLRDAQRIVRQRPRAAVIGTAAAVVAGARLMGTPTGERLKERLAPLKEQAIEAGRSVAEEMKPVAQHHVEQMKAVASEAMDQVAQEAEGAAADVKETATRAGRTVKGTAKRSATDVKSTATRSSATTKATARAAAAQPAPRAAVTAAVRRSPTRSVRTTTTVR